MIQRFAALMVVAGLGTGLVLRILAGRGRFGTFLTLALLPIAYHLGVTSVAGLRAGVEPVPTALFAAGSLSLALIGLWLGRRWFASRPWIAAVMPGLCLVAYLVAAVLPYSAALRSVDARLDTVPLFGTILGVIFTVCALLPFVARAPARGQAPRFPWQR